jgi:mannose-6-phosphate isomerase
MDIVKLKPAVKDYIWGGTKLKEAGKEAPFSHIAECWELSFHQDGPSLIASGPDQGKFLKDVATKSDLGDSVSAFKFFPVLIKLIDAADNLSVQVHPSDAYALKNENSYGKTEMWHIISAEKGAGLYVGFKKDTDVKEVEEALKKGTILSLLNFFEVKPGESYFISSGTIHAIGKGVTLIEIQQNSNLTYRLFDYNRIGKDGKPRELHIEKALKVIDYHRYEPKKFKGNLIGKCQYFSSYSYDEKEKHVKASSDSFASITFLEGEGSFAGIPFRRFDTFFIPAGKEGMIEAEKCRYILTRIERN